MKTLTVTCVVFFVRHTCLFTALPRLNESSFSLVYVLVNVYVYVQGGGLDVGSMSKTPPNRRGISFEVGAQLEARDSLKNW